MKKFFYKLWAKFITAFGNIKVFKFPMFMVYDPTFFLMDGKHIKQALDILEPGDVIMRGYNCYLDGMFIDDPFKYSHGGLYIGNDTVIHAVAEGVSEIDAIEFMECDRICIYRPKKYKREAISKAKKLLAEDTPYDFSFRMGNSAVYCFELCAECYKKLEIKTFTVKKLFGLLRRKAYLA